MRALRFLVPLLLLTLFVARPADAVEHKTGGGLLACADENSLHEAISLMRQFVLWPETMPLGCGILLPGMRIEDLGGDRSIRRMRVWRNENENMKMFVFFGSIGTDEMRMR